MESALNAFVCSAITVAGPLLVLAFLVWDTRNEVGRLRSRLKVLEGAPGPRAPVRPPAPEPVTAPAPVTAPDATPIEELPPPAQLPPLAEVPPEAPVEPGPPPPEPPRPPRRPPPPPFELPSPERLIAWFAGGLAGLTLLLAALFALVAMVERGWLLPSVRISLAFAAGTAAWVGGAIAARIGWRSAGAGLAGAGIGALYGTVWAASGLYHLLPSSWAGPLMIAITVVATLRAWRHEERFVAWLALFGGLLTPVLVSTGQNRPYSLFGYLALLLVGTLFTAARRGWWEVIGLAGAGVATLYLGWTAEWYVADQLPAALVGILLLHLPFLATSRAERAPASIAAGLVAAALPFCAIPWLVPVQETFVDPRSGILAVRSSDLGSWAPIAVAGWLATALFVPGRNKEWAPWLGLAPAAVLPLVTVGGLITGEPATFELLGAALGSALAVAVCTWRQPPAATPASVLQLVAAIAASAALGWLSPLGAVVVPIALLVTHEMFRSTLASGWVAVVAVAGLALTSATAAAALSGPAARAHAAGLMLAWLVLGLLPVRRTLPSWPKVGWLAAAAVPLAVFPALHATWVEALGTSAVGALPLAMGAVTLAAITSLIRRQRFASDDPLVSVFVLVVVGFVTAAAPLQVGERWLTLAWAVEAALLAWLANRVRLHELVRWVAIALSAAVGVRLLANPWALSWGTGEGWVLLNWTLYTWGLPFLCLLFVAGELSKGPPTSLPTSFRTPILLLALLVGFGLVNVEISHAFGDRGPLALDLFAGNRVESMVRSAGWAGYGLLILAAGLWNGERLLRFLGFCFVLAATGKVFVVDLWGLTGFVRVGSLFCLAVSLLVAAVVFERLVLRTQRTPAPPEAP